VATTPRRLARSACASPGVLWPSARSTVRPLQREFWQQPSCRLARSACASPDVRLPKRKVDPATAPDQLWQQRHGADSARDLLAVRNQGIDSARDGLAVRNCAAGEPSSRGLARSRDRSLSDHRVRPRSPCRSCRRTIRAQRHL